MRNMLVRIFHVIFHTRLLGLLQRHTPLSPRVAVRFSRVNKSAVYQRAMDVKLRLVQFECAGDKPGRVRLGAELDEGRVVDFNTGDADAMTCDMQEFLEHWEDSTAQAIKIIEKAKSTAKSVLEPGQYRLKSPITRPEKIICIGMNYVDHCTEQNIAVPEAPILFSKFNSAITHPGAPILLTEETTCLDYEVEMVFVMCKEGKNIKVHTYNDNTIHKHVNSGVLCISIE